MLASTSLGEGIHLGVPDADYHADPCETASASASALFRLAEFSPEHARHDHPRMNAAAPPRVATDAMNMGTVLHSLVLETEPPFLSLDVADYTTHYAKSLKATAIRNGFIPIKKAVLAELQDVAASLRARLQGWPDVWAALRDAVENRSTEATLIWRERGVLCRCRYDALPAARFRASWDLKFTGRSAAPGDFGRVVAGRYSFQSELYPRAVKQLRGDRPMFGFIACETDAPYGASLHALDPQAAAMTAEQVDTALDTWRECLATGIWPGYSRLIHYQALPPWVARAWEERRLADEQTAALDRAHDDRTVAFR